MILFSALMKGMIYGSENHVVSMNMGEIQIHAKGYLDDPDLYNRIKNSEQLLHDLHQQGFIATPRLYAYGLAAAHTASSGVNLRGIDMQREQHVIDLHQHVASGAWLDIDDPLGIVLGRKLAANLGVATGDEIIFVGQSADGFMANERFRVRGVLKSVADDIDRGGIFVPMKTFRELMVIPDGVHEIVVRSIVPHRDLAERTQHVHSIANGLEVKNWKALMPVVARMLETADIQTFIMLFITYIAVATVILNAMLMNVFERIHEFGMMRAVGVKPWQIVRLVYAETLVQTMLAILIAVTTGWWAANYYANYGIDMSSFAGSISYGGIAFDPIWYAYITPDVIWIPPLFLLLMALFAVIYPAAKAALIRPVDAIAFR
ncbi:MAG: FtsX-like permease family protein [Mariprofundaceae bacterium]